MKIVKQKRAQEFEYATTSTVLDYSMELNEKNMDFCINSMNGRYPEKGYCSNLECEELCYILDGSGTIFQKDNSITFEKRYLLLGRKFQSCINLLSCLE